MSDELPDPIPWSEGAEDYCEEPEALEPETKGVLQFDTSEEFETWLQAQRDANPGVSIGVGPVDNCEDCPICGELTCCDETINYNFEDFASSEWKPLLTPEQVVGVDGAGPPGTKIGGHAYCFDMVKRDYDVVVTDETEEPYDSASVTIMVVGNGGCAIRENLPGETPNFGYVGVWKRQGGLPDPPNLEFGDTACMAYRPSGNHGIFIRVVVENVNDANPPSFRVTVTPREEDDPCNPDPDAPECWWIDKEKGVTGGDCPQQPPEGWLGGPHPSEAIAQWYADQIGPKWQCVEFHDLDLEQATAEDPAPTFDVVPEPDPTPVADLTPTKGKPYVDCLSEDEIDELITDATEITVEYPAAGGVHVEFWGVPPRYPVGTFKDEPNVGDNPDADPRPPEETPPRWRKLRITDTGDGWYSEIPEYFTTDNCPDEPYTSGQPNLCADGVTTRFVTDTDIALPWYGIEGKKSGLSKCRENCPPCHRPRYCFVSDGEGGGVWVPDPEDRGTDWRADLPASDEMSTDIYLYASLCQYICSNPCNIARFPLLCDSTHVSYIGCADRDPETFETLAVMNTEADPLAMSVRPEDAVMNKVKPPVTKPKPKSNTAKPRKKGCGCTGPKPFSGANTMRLMMEARRKGLGK